MSEYISKEDISRVLLERKGANESCLSRAREKGLHETEQYFQNLVFEGEQIASLIEELPSADVRTNIHGHWGRRIVDNGFNADWVCSECGHREYTDFIHMNFCPNCGADMREPKGEKGTS